MTIMIQLTLSIVTRSAACSNVRLDISSTIFANLGSEGEAEDEELSAVAVASHLEPLASLRIKVRDMKSFDETARTNL